MDPQLKTDQVGALTGLQARTYEDCATCRRGCPAVRAARVSISSTECSLPVTLQRESPTPSAQLSPPAHSISSTARIAPATSAPALRRCVTSESSFFCDATAPRNHVMSEVLHQSPAIGGRRAPPSRPPASSFHPPQAAGRVPGRPPVSRRRPLPDFRAISYGIESLFSLEQRNGKHVCSSHPTRFLSCWSTGDRFAQSSSKEPTLFFVRVRPPQSQVGRTSS